MQEYRESDHEVEQKPRFWLQPDDQLFNTEINAPNHRNDQPSSGGYNEAFVISYWASYTPRF